MWKAPVWNDIATSYEIGKVEGQVQGFDSLESPLQNGQECMGKIRISIGVGIRAREHVSAALPVGVDSHGLGVCGI